ncbi:MAG: UDP-glucose 4-epimerase GalE [Mycoplasma sp.]|nr:UDP-glucose 4-epimerase GalE [Mycoplasma sp.]
MANILVIGGAGYIGSVVCEKLVNKHKVVILDDLSTGFKQLINKKSKFIKGSLLQTNLISEIIKDNKIDLVINLAAKIVVSESAKKALDYFETNVNGCLSVMKAISKTNVKRIIFASSAAVYGVPQTKIISESHTQNPCNVYGMTKSIDEKIISNIAKQYGINYLIFRFFNVSGANSSLTAGLLKKNPTWLIASINKSIINKEKFNIYGGKYKTKDHTALRDYIHVEDIANAHYLGVDYLMNKKPSAILNLGLGKAYTVKEVYDCARKLFKSKNNLVIKPNREGDPDCLLANITKAKKMLKWTPKYKLEDMIISDYKFQKKFIKY